MADTTTQRAGMPAVFLGHGSPMSALGSNRYTEAWRSLAGSIPRPSGIVAISAHWYIHASAVTAMARPRTIHDFFGFPTELFAFEYPAPGSVDLARAVVGAADPMWVGLDEDSWGLDHGTWSVLCHMYPDADVPVVQLSIDASKPFEHHLELGARLAPLSREGVLVVCSGNVVHNPQRADRERTEGFDWALRFDRAVADVMTTDPAGLGELRHHPDYATAVPTPDHFLPLAYLAGIARASQRRAQVLLEGYVAGAASMTAYLVPAG